MAVWLRHRGMTPDELEAGVFDVRLGAASGIVPAEAFGVLVSAREAYASIAAEREAILASAREEAQAWLDGARQQAQTLLAQAQQRYDEAQARGFEEARAQALEGWLERLAATAQDRAAQLLTLRERMAGIVTTAVEQIVQVQARDALYARALLTVEQIVESASWLRVGVHPEDHVAAQAVFGELAVRWQALGRPLRVRVECDARLEPGSCLCESDCGIVDAGLDVQLDAMRAAVARALHSLAAHTQVAAAAPADAEAGPDGQTGGDAAVGGHDRGRDASGDPVDDAVDGEPDGAPDAGSDGAAGERAGMASDDADPDDDVFSGDVFDDDDIDDDDIDDDAVDGEEDPAPDLAGAGNDQGSPHAAQQVRRAPGGRTHEEPS